VLRSSQKCCHDHALTLAVLYIPNRTASRLKPVVYCAVSVANTEGLRLKQWTANQRGTLPLQNCAHATSIIDFDICSCESWHKQDGAARHTTVDWTTGIQPDQR
jgi:hypothetical protein